MKSAAVQQVERRGMCEARNVLGKIPCGDPLGTGLQVHELKRGNPWRGIIRESYPEAMLLVCPDHHEWITLHHGEAVVLGLAWTEGTARVRLAALGWRSKSDIGYQEEP